MLKYRAVFTDVVPMERPVQTFGADMGIIEEWSTKMLAGKKPGAKVDIYQCEWKILESRVVAEETGK